MKIFENYNKAKQKFGENLAQQAINAKIPSKFIFAACKFNAKKYRGEKSLAWFPVGDCFL